MKNLMLMVITLLVVLVLAGCASVQHYDSTIPAKAVVRGMGGPMILISSQGGLPSKDAYRPVFIPVNTNAVARAVPWDLLIPVVGAALESADKYTTGYFGTMQKTYNYRLDVLVSGYPNLTPADIKTIFESGTTPRSDADRSAFQGGE